MLTRLSIRDLVLIERLDLDLAEGLTVLTGETGAGKSILLDALGLALGTRAEGRLVRRGAEQAQVTAVFELADSHPALALARDNGLDEEAGLLLLKRSVNAEGRSRAFVNDQPVSVSLLRSLGDLLVEVQGQFDQRGLMDWRGHAGLLDAYGRAEGICRKVKAAHGAWREARQAVEVAEARIKETRAEEESLRHALDELDGLDPQAGELEQLAEERQLLLHRGAILDALAEAERDLFGGGKAENLLVQALRSLERVSEKAGERLQPLLQALERSLNELEEVGREIANLGSDSDLDPDRLAWVEDRFFAMKDLARKHGVEAEALPALREEMAEGLAALEGGETALKDLHEAAAATEAAFRAACERLSKAREKAARDLDRAVNGELPPLKMDRARFETALEPLPDEAWTAEGAERIQFLVATNAAAEAGPIGKIASGGELARFLLALRVVLARIGTAETLVFDEVDAGIGGATAAAVGARLSRLAGGCQVLVVTHSPQVAARGARHLQVEKQAKGKLAVTAVRPLEENERREEIARMLAGAEITVEARQAAAKLLETDP